MQSARIWLSKTKLLILIFILLCSLDFLLAAIAFRANLFSSIPFIPTDQNRLLSIVSSPTEYKRNYHLFLQSVSEKARMTNYIEISHCSFIPKIAKEVVGQAVTFHNADTVTHTLTVPGNQPLQVLANSTSTLSLRFVRYTPTAIGIGCDANKTASGIIYIVPAKNHDLGQ